MDLKRIDPEEAQKLLDSGDGYVYLDVRTEEEFRAGHVPGAANVAVMVANPAGPGMIPNLEFVEQVVDRHRVIRRLKKRRLSLKDTIAKLESELIPDLDA